MLPKWQKLCWGELVKLEYGKGLRDYEKATGKYRVFGTNGPIGWHDEYICPNPSVIIGRKGAYRGIHYSKEPFYVIDTAFFLKPIHEIDIKWAYYNLLTQNINEMDSGSAIPSTSRDEFYRLPVIVPPLEEQQKIANILSSFDDKIELNRKMNATLEQIAQTIFKSWFVDFDPVKAKATGREPEGMDAETAALFPSEFEQSELGMIPKGWEKSQLGEICYNYRETVSPEKLDPKTLYIGLEHIPRKSIALDEWSTGSLVESGKSKFVTGDILFGKLRPYFHKVGVAPIDGICSTDILVIRPKRVSYFGIALSYLASEEIINYADRFSNGAKMPRINWKDLAVYEISIPPEEIAKIFSENISCIVEKIKINILESKLLRSIRDVILPRLISGQLRIPDVENTLGDLL
ncbi:MAG: restriction endonuclease subunit S [Acidobacteria bacterium]|nr:restriction endonuclease subunit S [Acidobacteriota bacterium]